MPKATQRRPSIRLSRVPQGIANAGAWRIERRQRRGTVTDVLHVHIDVWRKGRTRFGAIAWLARQPRPLARSIARVADQLAVSRRSVERWLRAYRKNPDIMAVMPKTPGPPIGSRRIIPERESLLQQVIDDWARAGQRLPVCWILEECKRRGKPKGIKPPSRTCVDARLCDRNLESLRRRRPRAAKSSVKPPRSSKPLEIVQIDHTLVDVMVVDELHRKPMGRPWVTVAFDIATRCVLGFHLSLHAPSAVAVGLTLAMSAVSKDSWLKERDLDFDWPMHGISKVLHLDNGPDMHSVAVNRGCDRYGIHLEYRPPGRPHYGGHIERYLGTLMRRIHGLAGTTFSSPAKRGTYRSEAHASMTMAELEHWIAIEIAGRYHHYVHRGIHGVPYKVWASTTQRHPVAPLTDPGRFVMDFLPAEIRTVHRGGFQINRIRY
jgi:putative transposase